MEYFEKLITFLTTIDIQKFIVLFSFALLIIALFVLLFKKTFRAWLRRIFKLYNEEEVKKFANFHKETSKKGDVGVNLNYWIKTKE